jgi:hypothetical protein
MRGPFTRSVAAEKNRPPLPLRVAQPSVNQGRIFPSRTRGRSFASLSNGVDLCGYERWADVPHSCPNRRHDVTRAQPSDEFLKGRKRTRNVGGAPDAPPNRSVRRACCRSATIWHGELGIHTEVDAPHPIGDHALLDHIEDAAERCGRYRAHLGSHVAAGDRHRVGRDHARNGESPTRCRATRTRGGPWPPIPAFSWRPSDSPGTGKLRSIGRGR